MCMYLREKSQLESSTVLINVFFTFGAFGQKHIEGKGPAKWQCVDSTWTTAIAFHMNELQTLLSAPLLRAV